ncbi:hypothetical protein EWM64_g7404 [Hericium alpestre]|uniref:Uncharacterized protein n=1 Tax=Hericium alpestre TaxID=135208 RepID=A0A4Y9ZSZ9_9AGAM|nr:hypothetical protein EWM64_g7404 [Hericium alpestre]
MSVGNDYELAEEWKDQVFQLLSDAHTLSGLLDISFEVGQSTYSDFAFDLQSDTFKWRWETFLLGPKLSAELLSKHLIVPLISTAHLAFTSADPVSELSDTDLEKAVDKVGRTARRTLDTHIRNAIMRPRVSTTVRRITALLDFNANLPAIQNDVPKPDLVAPPLPSESREAPRPTKLTERASPMRSMAPVSTRRDHREPERLSVIQDDAMAIEEPTAVSVSRPPELDGSATESDEDEIDYLPPAQISGKGKAQAKIPSSPPVPPSRASVAPATKRSHTPPAPSKPASPSEPESPRHPAAKAPPKKKVKADSSSEAESDGLSKQPAGRRGTRQPIKRGGRRF